LIAAGQTDYALNDHEEVMLQRAGDMERFCSQIGAIYPPIRYILS